MKTIHQNQKELQQEFLQTSMFTDLGKYKKEAIQLFEKQCDKSLKKLCLFLMHATVHRVILQIALTGKNMHEYGDFSFINAATPMCEDDIFLTAASMFAEIFRRDPKGFYIGRPAQNRLVVTCRYVSVLTSAILKANGIPCRSRAGWSTYLREGAWLDHWVNEYYNVKENRWVMFDLDDLYDKDYQKYPLYANNKIAEEYLDFNSNQFKSAAQVWLMYRKDPSILQKLCYGSSPAAPEHVLKYLFLDFYAVNNCEYSYRFMPACYNKPVKTFTEQELKQVDAIANMMLDVNKNYAKIKQLYQNENSLRMVSSTLVDNEDFEKLKNKLKNKK